MLYCQHSVLWLEGLWLHCSTTGRLFVRRSPSLTIRSCATAPSWSSPTSKTWCGLGPPLRHAGAAAAARPPACPLCSGCLAASVACMLGAAAATPGGRARAGGGAGVQEGSLTTAELCDALALQELKHRKWHVQASRAAPSRPLLPPCCCLQLVGHHRRSHLAAPKAVLLSPHPLPAVAAEGCTVQGWRWLTRMGAGGTCRGPLPSRGRACTRDWTGWQQS